MFEQVIETVAQNAKTECNFVDGDYYAPCFNDDPEKKVVYCGKCGKRKEFFPFVPTQPYPGNEIAPLEHRRYIGRKVAVMCDCEQDQRRKEKRARELMALSRERKAKCWGYPNAHGLFERNVTMEKITFDVQKPNKHINKALGFLSSFGERQAEGKGIAFIGKAGAGKTIAAMCLANSLMDCGVEVLFKQQFEITRLSQYEDKGVIAELESCKVLFVDDFNPEYLNANGLNMLFNIFEIRIKRGLITCFTSNITKAALVNPADNDINKLMFERIVKNCYIVDDSTNNYRKEVRNEQANVEQMESE